MCYHCISMFILKQRPHYSQLSFKAFIKQLGITTEITNDTIIH